MLYSLSIQIRIQGAFLALKLLQYLTLKARLQKVLSQITFQAGIICGSHLDYCCVCYVDAVWISYRHSPAQTQVDAAIDVQSASAFPKDS